ncbi:alpha-galactosidase [Acidicapsa dinghuensis]|uniref:Alpha-galactosidase n=1 Tax=Acidicapsa dinghuensis TaxID=2218256 RepID=A0ABW1EK61_9BACT|nr:alpha-galactosidase [Acidicapsa dinghuensis]
MPTTPRSIRLGAILLFSILAIGSLPVWSQAGGDAAIPLPPMGWSSWNSFSNRIDSKIAMQQAQALISTGMAKQGFQFVNIDEGWWLGTRDSEGNIVVEPTRWPAIAPGEHAGDMSNIVRYIHGLGLKAGIYTDAGNDGCSFYGPDLGPKMPHTGSEGHYEQDFLQFAKWGFDYVKVDWCGGNGENLDPALQYAEVARAIHRAEVITGHKLYYSICNWGKDSPWTWAPGIGGVQADIWRTSGDIVAPIVADSPNSSRRATLEEVLGNFDKGIHPEAQHTGYYNDPDMMVLGMPGLGDVENRLHMTLWAISGAPLLVGADLTKLSPGAQADLTNSEVIAIDQDPLGLQAVCVSPPDAKVEVWVKKLANTDRGKRAVLLLNRSATEQHAHVSLSELSLAAGDAQVRDVWTHRNLDRQSLDQAVVPAHDALLFIVEGREPEGAGYAPAATANDAPDNRFAGSAWNFSGVKAADGRAWITLNYSNPGDTTELMELRVNGIRQSAIALPASNASQNTVTLEVNLEAGNHPNQITLLGQTGGKASPTAIKVIAISGSQK